MPETTRDNRREATLRALLKKATPAQIRRLLADIRLSEFAELSEVSE